MHDPKSVNFVRRKSILVSEEEATVVQKIREIVSDGRDVEVKRNKDGSFKILSVQRKVA